MSKIITIIGATGTQGGSVVSALLHTNYTIRAITRNPSSRAAQSLAAKGVQLLRADLHDPAALTAAFAGTHAIFAVTNFFAGLSTHHDDDDDAVAAAMALETQLGINIATAAAATPSLEHLVWSTLPDSATNSAGAAVVPYYQSKQQVDAFIHTLPALLAKTTFLWVGWYSANMLLPCFHPMAVCGTAGYLTLTNIDPATRIPLVGDERVNVGLVVRAVLQQPAKTLPGRVVSAVTEYRALGEVVAAFGRVKGVAVRCVRIAREEYRRLWPGLAELMDVSHYYFQLTDGRSFVQVGEEVVGVEELGVEGLVGVEEAFLRVEFMG
ncbi:NAD(P)-binding protein [Aspergillus saccharolyticus JOP 1030-1]|uniref:NAD(P)-binding protein n=1 Tax=Aspergillus saccharolyticus JOP 1030-1 TaxID=1450539 RepID=A0A318Z935_9EURO|nr:NAD(P)-binding protein [Aspergillus saccharolyticus JOP 1030-1]PYH43891.1 NAD(P)-binding protein [Aspergillus saccharolyticus JOP 1030-1]